MTGPARELGAGTVTQLNTARRPIDRSPPRQPSEGQELDSWTRSLSAERSWTSRRSGGGWGRPRPERRSPVPADVDAPAPEERPPAPEDDGSTEAAMREQPVAR